MFQSTPASGWHASQTQKRKVKYFNPHPLPDDIIKIPQHQAYVKPPKIKKPPLGGIFYYSSLRCLVSAADLVIL
uniref:Uncharacterized protein n=1 Tax=Siphoviridae sp. ct91l7 TaxID=2826173 RepID=A0A8S5MXH3_9CAUD|nr:MAG TPA: hypothetical protein [Siphoviridae sp. ct91l7]